MKKVTRIIPCVLVLSILAYIPLTVYAYQGGANYRFQGKGDERLEQIMDLVEKARIRASISLQLSQNLGFDVSRLQEKYRLGLQLMDNANLEYRNGKYVEALNYAFQAMNAFRECIRNATRTIAEDRANVSIGWMGLTVAVDRLEEFVKRVNSSVQAAKTEGMDVSVVEDLLEEVKATIAEIKNLLRVGNISSAAKLLGDARAKASAALAMLRRIVCAEHIMVKRMERYLEKFEEARSKIYDRLRMVPQHIRERVRLKLDEVENLLNEVRGMIRNRIMERVMNRIMEMHRRLLDILNETKG